MKGIARRMAATLAIAGSLAATTGDATASAVPGGAAVSPESDPVTAVRAEAAETERFFSGTWRLRVSWPLQASGAVGVLRGRRPATWDCDAVCEFRGLHAQAEWGTGGAQVAAGWASLVGEEDRSSRWLSRVYVGYAVRGALLRTGGLSTLDPKSQTFVGLEGTLAAVGANVSVSVYRRVSRGPSPDPWIVGAGVGWGF